MTSDQKLFTVLMAMIFIVVIVLFVTDQYSTRRMAELGFCYEPVNTLNQGQTYTWLRCK